MIVIQETLRVVLVYDDYEDDFRQTIDENISPKDNIYIIIDEENQKTRLFIPESTPILMKRTIERRVSSFLKVGFPLDNKGLRLGANYKFEIVASQELAKDSLIKPLIKREGIQEEIKPKPESKKPEEFNYKSSYKNGYTYEEYIGLMKDENHKKKYESYYSRFTLSPEYLDLLSSQIEHEIKILVIGASWCFDCQINITILQHIVEKSPNLEMKIIIKEEYIHLVDLTNAGQRIPLILFLSPDFYKVESWVEKSTLQYQLYGNLRKIMGWDNPNFTKEYRKLFIKDYEKFSKIAEKELVSKIIRTDALLSTSTRLHKH